MKKEIKQGRMTKEEVLARILYDAFYNKKDKLNKRKTKRKTSAEFFCNHFNHREISAWH